MNESNKIKAFILHAIYHCGKMDLKTLHKGVSAVWPDMSQTSVHCLAKELHEAGTLHMTYENDGSVFEMTVKGYMQRHKPCKPYWYVILKIKFFMILRVIFAELYYHPKSDGFYIHWMVGGKLEKDASGVVVYTDLYDTTWVRPSSEFYDGRFVVWSEANSLLQSLDPTEK